MRRFFMYILKIGSISYFREMNAFNPIKPTWNYSKILQLVGYGWPGWVRTALLTAVIYWLKSLIVIVGPLLTWTVYQNFFFFLHVSRIVLACIMSTIFLTVFVMNTGIHLSRICQTKQSTWNFEVRNLGRGFRI